MTDAFTGEIRIFGGSFAPQDWAFCQGQFLPVSQFSALFSILGIAYGGDGQTTFALPNLQGRAPMGAGTGDRLTPRALGDRPGVESVSLTVAQMPAHTHQILAADEQIGDRPTDLAPAPYGAYGQVTSSMSNAVAPSGESVPHVNQQPSLALNFIICLHGEYPARP